ncbi:TPA: hypothetical protein QDB06_001284 [Burkholderia vietnamiensis]|jgi:hypothetical protein|uniref:hypothetical protein n=1 Tax=Burkholderia vietnamiensis TaxID=60552 RepID=UPI000ABDEE65|nr:hypothetical protein [Burkholderia vietnamiensis]MBR7974422.1 hypothetical protein [Burkholderia vietnamiensis]MCA8184374.1 hypothetical protein [Burkholderia vietnamiensis]HDR9180751.1 hypothetical protein [Burkholderia vietnamiensis]
MLFGTKSEFAIEAMIEPGLVPPSAVYGRMRVWCENTSLGDFSNPRCSLYPAYLGFKRLGEVLPNLWLDDLSDLSDEGMVDRLDRLLYGARGHHVLEEDDRTAIECELDWDKYGIFNFLTNWGEQFDREPKSFIVCPPGQHVKVLVRTYDVDKVLSLRASVSATIDAIRLYLKWFDDSAVSLFGAAG